MSLFRKTALILSIFLSFNAKPVLAESSQETDANPNLLHQGSYGPVQKNDTLWSIAKLLKNRNESINDVVAELTLANPKAIKPGSKLFIGQYIHRYSTPKPAQDTASNIEQLPSTVSKTQELNLPTDTNIDLVTTNPTQDSEETVTMIISYAFFAIVSVFIGFYFGLTKIKRQCQQQKIVQDEINKTNALKREAIKNRLKTTSVMDLC